jgi:flagellar hook-associated protein 2
MVETTTNATSSRPTVDGLSSGIESSKIIDAFIKAERSSTALIEKQKTLNNAKLEAVRSFNTKLLSAQLDLSSLKQSSTFSGRTATSSNTDAVSIVKSATSAAPGTYTLDVRQVAKFHQLSTAGQSSADATYNPGTISLQMGSGPATQLNFDSGGSLNDIATAINSADLGINATVINDGSSSPYRLMLKGEKTGVENTILVSGTGGFSSLLNSSNLTELSEPENAIVRIGSTLNFIDIEQASNVFSNVVPGVDFQARETATNVSITVQADTESAEKKITSFIESLNSSISYLKDNSSFDGATKAGGILIGQANLITGLNRLIQTMTGSVSGLPSSLNTLSAIGIRLDQNNGTFNVDKSLLNDKLKNDPNGVMKLFNSFGSSSNPAIQFSFLNEKTNVDSPFTVNITQPALQATLATTDLSASTTINNSNNTLTLSINNNPITVTLTNDTYTRDELAQHLQSVLNAAASSDADKVTVSLANNRLDVRSNFYGSTKTISISNASTALTALGISAQSVRGVNVAGTINGVEATGNGRVLSGAVGSASEGLSLSVTSVVPITGATITANKSMGQLLSESFSTLTDNASGTISGIDKALTTSISDQEARIKKADLLLDQRRARYTQEFLTMERLIQSFNSQGTAITNFIDALTNANSKK